MLALKNTFLGKIVFFILLFLFIYPFKLAILPISFRVLFAAFGGALLLLRLLSLRNIYFSNRIIKLCFLIVPVCLYSAFTVFIVNGTRDFEYVNFWILPIVCLLSAYFVVVVGIYTIDDLDFFRLSKFYIGVVLAQAIISAVMFVNPTIYHALLTIQQMDALDMTKSESLTGQRLLGLGASFMIMGIINCIALLLIVVLLKYQKLSMKFRIYLIIAYLIIFVIGMMQARTTVVGLLVSVSYIFFSSFSLKITSIKKTASVLGSIVIVSLFLFVLVEIVAGDFIKENQQVINYGFDLVLNYQKTGKLESSSTTDLEHMYVWPKSIKTYLTGDGKFYNVPGVPLYGYYMSTDVGIIRLIYYFGIPGLFFFMLYQFALTKYSFTINVPGYKVLIFYFFLLVILWNLKNVLDTNILFAPFCVLNVLRLRFSASAKKKMELHSPSTLAF